MINTIKSLIKITENSW